MDKIRITYDDLNRMVNECVQRVLTEVRYIDTRLPYMDYDEVKSKAFVGDENFFNSDIKLVGDNGKTLTYALTPRDNSEPIEDIAQKIRNIYRFKYKPTIKTFPERNLIMVAITPESNSELSPIAAGEKIRVFHGMDIKDAILVAKEGLSGKEVVTRSYSYEHWMNPAGLFVTTDFNIAKGFGYAHDAVVILEFTVDTKDVDTPV